MSQASYWARKMLSRRKALRGAAVGGGGLVALSLVGCGGDDDDDKGAAQTDSGPALDSTKGTPGGKLTFQSGGVVGNPRVGTITSLQANRAASLIHSGLYGYSYGRPPSNGIDAEWEPDLAMAMPEQPDQLTYVVKIRQDAKFQNGRKVVAADIKYTFERLARAPESNRKNNWLFLDKIDAPDDQTMVLTTKAPFADTLGSMTQDRDGFIVAKEYEETPEAGQRMMGSGPYTWVEDQPPIQLRLKRNPDYYNKPYPYFDEIVMLEAIDKEKQVADFSGKQLQLSFWFPEDGRDRLKQSRPDAKFWSYEYAAQGVGMRTDMAPFSDKRVRQGLSMGVDAKKIRDGATKGEGRLDQTFSLALGPKWGFREPKEFGAAAKYREYNPQGAKQLLSAAGITQPIECNFYHFDASFAGQAWVDFVTLTVAGWREIGIANVKATSTPFALASTTNNIGNYEGMTLFGSAMAPTPGLEFRNRLWSPPEGVKVPTQNLGHINDQELSGLIDKHLAQLKFEDRKQTLRRAEEIMAEEMYRIPWSTYGITYFSDPALRNLVVPVWNFGHSGHWIKYWWFDGGKTP